MRIHKTSVLLIDTKGKNKGVVQVPTHFLKCWKRYLLGFTTIILGLIFVSGFLAHRATSESYQLEIAEAFSVKDAINVVRAQRSFQSIDESIYRINTFLQERGLTNMQMDNVGGGSDFVVTDVNEIADFYESQLREIEQILQFLPLGVPHHGQISSRFGPRRNPFTRRGVEFHSGVDFRGNIGDTIRSTANGVVEFVGWRGGYGNTIIILHENDLRTLYAHLSSINVVRGQEVAVGEFIGRLGNTGRSTGPHLHYEIIAADGRRLNPADFFSLDIY